MSAWTVIQRKRMSSTERDLAIFFDPLTEDEARALARRLISYDPIHCSYRVEEVP